MNEGYLEKAEAELKMSEQDAEYFYYDILEEPELNGFDKKVVQLLKNPVNQKALADIELYSGKIQYIHDLLDRRSQICKFELAEPIPGVEVSDVDVQVIRRTVRSIEKNQKILGTGLDAYVVVDESELPGLPAEICYKIAKEEATPRGRNTLKGEVDTHLDFYRFAQEMSGSSVGIPRPHYTLDLPDTKIIAMEALDAVNVAQLMAGKGGLPDWFDINRFVGDVQEFLDKAHAVGLYHRDLHVGNIMIRQGMRTPEDGKLGYMIDFGLSLSGAVSLLPDENPYQAELVSGDTFDYLHDDAVIEQLANALHKYRNEKM